MARCRTRPRYDLETVADLRDFQDTNCTSLNAPLDVPITGLDHWITFAETVDITGIAIAGAGPDFDLMYCNEPEGSEMQHWHSYPGSHTSEEGFHRLRSGLWTTKNLMLRWHADPDGSSEKRSSRVAAKVLGCEHTEGDGESQQRESQQPLFEKASAIARMSLLIATGCLLLCVLRCGLRCCKRRVEQDASLLEPALHAPGAVEMVEGSAQGTLHDFHALPDTQG